MCTPDIHNTTFRLLHQYSSFCQVLIICYLSLLAMSQAAPESTRCGTSGKPNSGDVSNTNDLVYKYICMENTVLIGNDSRVCSDGKFTGAIPICMPFMSNDVFKTQSETIKQLLEGKAKSIQEFHMKFNSMYVTFFYIWLDESLSSIQITISDSVKINSSQNYTRDSLHFYVFNISRIIYSLSVNLSDIHEISIQKISFADSGITVRCGMPDTPKDVLFEMVDDIHGNFYCRKGYSLSESGNIKCIGLEKWNFTQTDSLNCNYPVSLTFIYIAAVLGVLLLILLVCVFIRLITKNSLKKIDKSGVIRDVMDSYSGIKVDANSISMIHMYEKVNNSNCSVYTAKYKGNIVCAHVCCLNQKNDQLVDVRCLMQSVSFNYRNDNLVNLIAITNDSLGNPVLIFPYFPNGHLDVYVRRNPNLSTVKLIQLNQDVANGMAYLSMNNVVHRDLRGNSCYVDDSTVVKVGNFLYARTIEPGKGEILIEGNIELERMPWAAPECIASNIWALKSDVWSFGVLMWEVFSLGDKPFLHKNETEITTFLVNEEKLSKPIICPANTYQLMLNCWNMDYNERPSFGNLSKELTI